LTFSDDGSFTYVPNSAGYTGSDTFTYKATDGTHESAAATVTIEIVNSVPAAVARAFEVHQGTSLVLDKSELALACSDADEDTLTVALPQYPPGLPTHGTLLDNYDGTVTYTPCAGFTGLDSFTYKVNDGAADSNAATVTVSVTDTAPTGRPGYFSGRHGAALTGNVLATASDPDGDPITAELPSGVPQGGASHGIVSLSPDGTFSYMAQSGFAGTDSFTFLVKDGAKTSPLILVTLEVLNVVPQVADLTDSVHQGQTLVRAYEAWDADGDTLTRTVTKEVDRGTLLPNSMGEFIYTPTAGYVGTDTFKLRVNDGIADSNEATITIEVTNSRPVAGDVIYTTPARVQQGGEADTPSLLERSWDNDADALTLTAGSLRTDVLLNHGILNVYSSGQWTYVPIGTSAGVDSFTYQVFDGAEESDPATVTIYVLNEAPQAQDQAFRFQQNSGTVVGDDRVYSFSLTSSGAVFDPDQDPTTVSKASDPGQGTLDLTLQGQATLTIAKTFVGSLTFTYKATDGIADSTPATVTVLVDNAAPEPSDDFFAIRTGGVAEFTAADLLQNDLDADGDTLTIVSLSNPSPGQGTLTPNSQTGGYTYSPGNFVGTATMTYQVSDGAQTSAPATVSIDVRNTAPWTVAGSFQVRVGHTLDVAALTTRGAAWDNETSFSASLVSSNAITADDFEDNGSFSFHPTTQGTYTVIYKVSDGLLESGTVTITIEAVEDEEFTVDEEQAKYGSFAYEEGYGGIPGNPPQDFQYTPPAGGVPSTNTPPAAANDGLYRYRHGTTITTSSGGGAPGVLLNDYDPDNDTLSVSVKQWYEPAHGTLQLQTNGHFTYTPTQVGGYDYVGTDSFVYVVTDGVNSPDPPVQATAYIELTNQAPIAKNATYRYLLGAACDVPIPATDPDGEALSYEVTRWPNVGTLHTTPYFWFVPPAPPWTGQTSFDYKVTDGAGATATGTITLIIVQSFPPDTSVVAGNDQASWYGPQVTDNVLGNDGAHDYGTVTAIPTSQAGAYGSFSLSSNGIFTYTVSAGQEDAFASAGAKDEFTYTAQDAHGHSASATVTIKPRLLKPGETLGASSGSTSISVTNGVPYVNGLGSVYVWIAGTAVHLKAESGPSFLLSVDTSPDNQAQVYWSGAADYLNLSVDGNVASNISGVGRLVLSASGNVPAVSAGTVHVSAGGNVGAVSASDRVFSVWAGNYYTGQGDVASVTASGNVHRVWAAHNVGPVVSSSANVGSVIAGHDVASVSASGGSVGKVHAVHDVQGSVTAGSGDVGFFRLGADDFFAFYTYSAPAYDYPAIGGVFAGNEIGDDTSDFSVSATSGAIAVVHAGQNVKGTVTAGKSIYFVRAEEGSITKAITAGRHVGLVDAEEDVSKAVTATGGNIGKVRAGHDILGAILAGKSIGGVTAGKHLKDSVTAQDGSIIVVYAGAEQQDDDKYYGKIDVSSISATENIGLITSRASAGCGGEILAASISAGNGYIGDVTAHALINADISASRWIGTVQSGVTNEGGIAGSIESTNSFVKAVTANKGSISAGISAHTDVGPVWARDSISGNVEAEGYVVSVFAQTGSVAGVSGQMGVANVTAGTDVTGSIRSDQGSLGTVLAGNYLPGDVLGSIYAEQNIAAVRAKGRATGEYQWADPGSLLEYLALLIQWINDGDAGGMPSFPAPSKPKLEKGNIAGSVEAGGNIGRVEADGNIQSSVVAYGELPSASAKGSILQQLSCGLGSMAVSAGDAIVGAVTAAYHAVVSAPGTITGPITAQEGAASVRTASQLVGPVSGHQGAGVLAYSDVLSPTIDGGTGYASVLSFGSVRSQITATTSAALLAGRQFTGSLICHNGSAVAAAFDKFQANVRGEFDAVAISLKAIGGSVLSNLRNVECWSKEDLKADMTSRKNIVALAGGALTSKITAEQGSAYIEAASVTSPGIFAPAGYVGLNIYGSHSGKVEAKSGIALRARGNAQGPFTTESGYIRVVADGNVSGNVKAGGSGKVSVVSWGNVNCSEISSAQSDAAVFSYGPLTGKINAGNNAWVSTWNQMNADVTAKGNADVVARQDVAKPVKADKSATVISGADILADVTANAGTQDPSAAATAIAHRNIYGNVSGAASATADSLGQIIGNVTATTGNVLVSALTGYDGNAKAATDAMVFSGAEVVGNVEATNGSARVVAHEYIADFTCNAGANATVMADTTFNGTVTAKGAAAVSALDSLDSSNITATGTVRVFAGKDAKATATSRTGSVEIVALGDVEGSATAATDAFVAAFGGLSDLTVRARMGSASVFARGSIAESVSVTAATQLTASSMADVQGYFSSFGTASLFAAGDFDAGVIATKTASVQAGNDLKGSVLSEDGDVFAASLSGSLDASLEAYRNVVAVALTGGIGGSVTAQAGNATASAYSNVSAKISAGRDARVWTLSSVTQGATISAEADARVIAFGSVEGTVTAKAGNATVLAGQQISGDVTGHVNAVAWTATGPISGSVTAQVADAVAVGGGPVTGVVHGQVNALSASLVSVSGNVTANTGYATAIAQGGQVSGHVTAALGAAAIAFGCVTGPVLAGTDALVATLDTAVGTVTAGRDAVVIAATAVGGAVDAQRHAIVISYGAVSGGVNATTGDAVVLTWGSISGGVHAGDSAFVWAGEGVSGSFTATNDVAVLAVGWAHTTFLTAGRDAYLWTGGNSDGLVDAGRDAMVVSCGSSQAGVIADRDAFVLVYTRYQGNVYAGQDALVVSFGSTAGGVIAGRDAAVWSIDYSIGTVLAERYAGLVTWGTAAGPFIVDGGEGAFAFVYRDFNGEVRSANGSAFLCTFGTAFGNVTGGEDAAAWVVGNFVGSVTASEYAGAVVLGNFRGSVSAGLDGFILGEGNLTGSLSAGRDAFVWTLGNVLGSYQAGQDIAVVAYGSMDAKVAAGRDVGYVWARGNLTGVISAGRNIGRFDGNYYYHPYDYDVFSYGSIDAVIVAPNTSGGKIGGVGAWYEIDGQVRAATSIGTVHAGDEITATIVAPQIGSVIEDDASLRTSHPYPSTPESIKDAVLAEAATVYGEVVAARAEVGTDIEEALAAIAAERVRAFNERSELIAEVKAANARNKADAAAGLEKARQEAEALVWRLLSEAMQAVAAAQGQANAAYQTLSQMLDQIKAARNAAYDQAVALWNEEDEALNVADGLMASLRQKVLDGSTKDRQKWEETLDERVREVKKAIRDVALRDIRDGLSWAGTALMFTPVPGAQWVGAAFLGVSAYISWEVGDRWTAALDALGAVTTVAGKLPSLLKAASRAGRMGAAEGRAAQLLAREAALAEELGMANRARQLAPGRVPAAHPSMYNDFLPNLARQGKLHPSAASAARALTKAEERAITKIENTIRDHLSPKDLRGALRDMVGNPVPKPGGGYWDHVREVNEAIGGLRKRAKTLEGLADPAAQAARQRALDAISRAEEMMRGAGL